MQSEKSSLKPKIDDAIQALLVGEVQSNALTFVAYVKTLRMTPQWASVNSWSVSYKGKRVCYIKIVTRKETNSWYIRPAVRYDDMLADFCVAEGLTEVMLTHVHHCVGCGKCAPGMSVTFWGEVLEHVCCSPIDFEFHDPDAAALHCVERLVEFRRAQINGEKLL